MKQFIYVLKLVPYLILQSNWTEREERIVAEHFDALQLLLKENKLIMAGRTDNMDETTFGIAVFQASSQTEAEKIMESDPAVKKGIMTAELFPYRVALINPNFEVE